MDKIQSTLFAALRASGKILKQGLLDRAVVAKKSDLSLVTKSDKAAEMVIVEIIRRDFPDHAILTEESPPMKGAVDARWIIDPLDGTTNFAHTFPVAAVSIAYEEKGVLKAGGVLDPFRDELFSAVRGQGATLNGQPISVSQTPSLEESLLATGFPYDRKQKAREYLEYVHAFMLHCQGIRRAGAAAIDLCYVACGRFDGFWELQLNAWDIAAGVLLIEEAGGTVTDFSGTPLQLDGGRCLATNTKIHQAMLSVLKPFVPA